jgi:hypothetical protein
MLGGEPAARLDSSLARLRALTAHRPATGTTHDDADERLGTVASDDAIGFDPWPLLRALHRRGALVVVMGQVAGILHGSEELTGDLDLLWTGEVSQHHALVQAFEDVGATLTADGERVDRDPFERAKLYFRAPSASGDLCTPDLPWGSLPVREFIARADSTTSTCGTVIRYISRLDLILMRRAVGREKDLRRALELERLSGTNAR